MSLHLVPVSLWTMRGLVVAALASAAATACTPATHHYHSFFSGVTVGILLVLAVSLFRAHAAEVEDLPPAKPRDQE